MSDFAITRTTTGIGLLTRPAPRSRRSSGVHPGWLAVDPPTPEIPVEDEDKTRFSAFMQLLRTAGALDRAATDTLADLDLTAGAFGALLELADNHPTGIAPSELARRLSVARRTATLYVDILSRHGWAERNAHPDDRRMVLARLTDEGLRLVDDLSDSYQRRLAALLGDLSPMQAERLRQLLTAVNVSGKPRPATDDESL
ncbi:MAG TPA: MarR family transcriptional regulator [Thermomicrobiales bacterium]|jgi:DNA-binding MarR family transcriptional regulator|nr:MarR family transcriptional regulator [Thermomicrobiales bacterium]